MPARPGAVQRQAAKAAAEAPEPAWVLIFGRAPFSSQPLSTSKTPLLGVGRSAYGRDNFCQRDGRARVGSRSPARVACQPPRSRFFARSAPLNPGADCVSPWAPPRADATVLICGRRGNRLSMAGQGGSPTGRKTTGPGGLAEGG